MNNPWRNVGDSDSVVFACGKSVLGDQMEIIERAKTGDAENVLNIVQDACDRLREKNIKQWPAVFPRHYVELLVQRGEFYILKRNQKPVAAFRLLWLDIETWGEDDGLAGYLHTLSVHREAKGTGVGSLIIGWAMAEVLRHDRRALRLDCVAGNAFLRAYYAKLGFREIEQRQVGNTQVVLFEKP